jgi:glycosyltransferase involved in cell wall biosynthesis
MRWRPQAQFMDSYDRDSVRLSIVIPVKDDGVPLRRCLAALTSQVSARDEIVVVDNGSTDESAGIAAEFGATVIREPVPGIAAASAAGYDYARGWIVGRLDADSVPDADWVATVVEFFETHPRVAAVTGAARFTDGPAALRKIGAVAYLGSYFVLVSLALGHVPLFGSNCAFRSSEWRRVGARVHRDDDLVHDDMDLSVHIGPVHSIRFLPRLRVGISSRPLYEGGGSLRMKRAWHTLLLHWPHDLPWLRGFRRIWAALSRRRGMIA